MQDVKLNGRLISLRRMCPEDAEPLYHYRSMPEVSRYQDWLPENVKEAHDLADSQAALEPAAPDSWLQFIICRRDNGDMVGDCGIKFPGDGHATPELGIALHPDHRRRGYATAATRLMLDYLFDQLNARRVEASTDPRNLGAIGVLNRLGFRNEAHMRQNHWQRGEWTDTMVFAILREEWARERGAVEG